MIYQDPLAYLLGLEGIALLDTWAGDHDRAFTDARLAEIRRLLDDDSHDEAHLGTIRRRAAALLGALERYERDETWLVLEVATTDIGAGD